jgi:hypothetical protein
MLTGTGNTYVVAALVSVVRARSGIVGIDALVSRAGVVRARVRVVAFHRTVTIASPRSWVGARAVVAQIFGARVTVVSTRIRVVFVMANTLLTGIRGARVSVVTIARDIAFGGASTATPSCFG